MKANNKPPGKTIHASYIVDMEKGMELPMVLRVQIASTFSIMLCVHRAKNNCCQA